MLESLWEFSSNNPRSYHIGFLAIVELTPIGFLAGRAVSRDVCPVGNLVRCAKQDRNQRNESLKASCRRAAHKIKQNEIK